MEILLFPKRKLLKLVKPLILFHAMNADVIRMKASMLSMAAKKEKAYLPDDII